MWVFGSWGGSGPDHTAWPPAGYLPQGLFDPSGWGGSYTLDANGWTVQSDDVSLNGAAVTVTEDGVARSVSVTNLAGNYGSGSAIRILPDFTTKVGSTYEVEVAASSDTITYDFTVVDCD
jgi:hypothetical protein